MGSSYIAVDCGKYDTKVSVYKADTGEQRQFKLRTKMSPGVFEEDMLKKSTVITQVDGGPICMYGFGAVSEPDMETSKKTDIHRIGTLTAIALALGEGTYEDVYAAIGVPLDVAGNTLERIAYKDYILGKDGDTHTVQYKCDSEGPIKTVTFTIRKRFVYPEGSGVLWLHPAQMIGSAAIIDIGNLNTNCIYAEGLNPEDKMCFTGELGGKALITGLCQSLEAELGNRVVNSMVAMALAQPEGKRHLISVKGDKALEERSAKIIAQYALEHVRMIKQQCDLHHWPLAFANVVCVGGTVKLISKELHDVFGDIFIPAGQEYANAAGHLKRMCATLGVDIEKGAEETAAEKKKAAKAHVA